MPSAVSGFSETPRKGQHPRNREKIKFSTRTHDSIIKNICANISFVLLFFGLFGFGGFGLFCRFVFTVVTGSQETRQETAQEAGEGMMAQERHMNGFNAAKVVILSRKKKRRPM